LRGSRESEGGERKRCRKKEKWGRGEGGGGGGGEERKWIGGEDRMGIKEEFS